MKHFRDILSEWIGDRGLVAAGAALGVAASTVHYWLRGETTPPATRLPRLAEVIGLPEADLRSAIAAQRAPQAIPKENP